MDTGEPVAATEDNGPQEEPEPEESQVTTQPREANTCSGPTEDTGPQEEPEPEVLRY